MTEKEIRQVVARELNISEDDIKTVCKLSFSIAMVTLTNNETYKVTF